MMTGAPNTGVTAFRGIMPDSPGKMQMRLQSKAMALPANNVTGNKELWLEVPNINLAMCGTANPMNDTGPQKAVVTAVRIPVEMSNKFRVRLMFTPRFSAYRVPNNMALSGLIRRMASTSPLIVNRAK